ncbi:hypothetical protein [Salicibibacter halophilus]|uniref:hypothetical protein n=1 Tax=Salicibibacter halophilus TaxID=2502791 RepID=UPI0013586B3E|nr:hypothetical protein [Salicibibacter halophilus]
MEKLEILIDVQKRADKLRKKTSNSEQDIYRYAINDFMVKKRKKILHDEVVS